MKTRVGIGQDSHRFSSKPSQAGLVLGGIIFKDHPPLQGNSDADVVLHSLTNAISGVTCVNILGETADSMCLEEGITDSGKYLQKALEYLDGEIVHVSISIECRIPRITPAIPIMRANIARLLGISPCCVGITASSGEELTAFGRGEGIQVFSCVTVSSE